MNDRVMKSKFDCMYSHHLSTNDGVKRASVVVNGGKRALICEFGSVGAG